MGRSAQRKRRGGGGPPPSGAAITILSVTVHSILAGELYVLFSGPVTAADFDNTQFTDVTVGDQADTITQVDAVTLNFANVIDWGGTIAVGDDWTYTDTVPGVATPQSGVTV